MYFEWYRSGIWLYGKNFANRLANKSGLCKSGTVFDQKKPLRGFSLAIQMVCTWVEIFFKCYLDRCSINRKRFPVILSLSLVRLKCLSPNCWLSLFVRWPTLTPFQVASSVVEKSFVYTYTFQCVMCFIMAFLSNLLMPSRDLRQRGISHISLIWWQEIFHKNLFSD